MAKKIYFIGGGDLENGELKGIDRLYIQESKNKKVYVLDLTTDDPNKLNKYRIFLKDYFKGIGASDIEFFSLRKDLDSAIININSSGIIYIPGGDTVKLLNNIKKNGIDLILKDFNGIIVGNSAGALVLCEKTIVTKDEDNDKTLILDGIGLVNFSIEVHYDGSQDLELESIKNIEIYAIKESCALVYEEGKMRNIGEIRLFNQLKKDSC